MAKKKNAAAAPAKKGAGSAAKKSSSGFQPRLKVRYREEIVPKLQKEFGIENVCAVPRIEKIALNIGLGEASRNFKLLEAAQAELGAIAGQAAAITRAKKSIAAFKLREGMSIGTKVTLRRDRMYEFVDRLVNIALPRVRDFRGLSPKSFDGRGNYALGIKEQIVFPEIDYDRVDDIRGLDIVIVTTAKTDQEARALLKGFDFPFVN